MTLTITKLVVYEGGYISDLVVETDRTSPNYGWLLMKHPDGQWVTCAPILNQLEATGMILTRESAIDILLNDAGESLEVVDND